MKRLLPVLLAIPIAIAVYSLNLRAPSAEEVGTDINAMCSERHLGNAELTELCFNRNVDALNEIGEWLAAYGDTSAGQNLQSECSGHRPDWERVGECLDQGTVAAKSKGIL